MNRHFWRAYARGAGFSFVELLVTIVIAGIAFAAMVPVFVQATQKNSADALRLQAAHVAQDKIEKIRQLPYTLIAANASDTTDNQAGANLYDRKFADQQFGWYTDLQTGSGARRIFLDYQVTLYPAAATGLASQYKVVEVTATWAAPPSPVKPVVLQTIVYRQYAGPPLDAFSTNPGIDDAGVLGGANLTSVTLTTHVDTTAGAAAGSVQFEVAAFGGQTIASRLVTTDDTDQGLGYWYDSLTSTFNWTWDCSYAANQVYDFQATAYSADEYAGNSMHLYPKLNHTVLTAPPGAVIATAGNGKVSLSWGVSSVTGLTGYDIFRASSANPASWGAAIATVGQPATSYTDTTVANDPATPYYYAVRAVTGTNHSILVVSNPVTPSSSIDGTPPTALTSPLVATAAPAAPTITLTWGAATDVGGLLHYEVCRGDNPNPDTWGASPLTLWTNLTTRSYPDASAGWSSTWYYRVRAVDLALNAGPWSNVAYDTTIAEPHHDLHISVKTGNGNDCYVWVLSAANGHYYATDGTQLATTPVAGTYIAMNGSVVFANLPDGAYTVYASKTSLATATPYGATVQNPFGDLTKVKP